MLLFLVLVCLQTIQLRDCFVMHLLLKSGLPIKMQKDLNIFSLILRYCNAAMY